MNPRAATSYIIGVSIVGLAVLGGATFVTPNWVEPLVDAQTELRSSLAEITLPVVEQENGSYVVNVFSGSVVMDRSGITYQLQGQDESLVSFRETMIGGDTSRVVGRGNSPTRVNTFYGNNPEEWNSDLQTFSSVWYEEVWDGIDVEVISKKDTIEKFLYVAPGANPYLAQFEVSDGALSIDESGNLVISQPNGDYQMTAPVAWQDIDGKRVDVEVAYEVMGSHYGFVLGDYNPNYELIIDPLLAGTYIGSGFTDIMYGQSIEINDVGEIVVLGTVFGNLAGTPTPGYDTYNSGLDVFVAKFDQDLAMTAISFIGTSSNEYSNGGLVIDSSGSIYIGGETFSSSFPTTSGVYDTEHDGWESFVSKFSSDLSTLEASTFAGGFGSDEVAGLALSSDESSIYAVIKASSDYLFPLGPSGYSQSDYGSQDAVVVKLSSDLQTIEAGTFFGTTGTDTVEDIVVDSNDNIFITGEATSGLPVTTGAYDETFGGVTDAYVAKFSADLSSLISSTYIGGDASEEGLALALDSDENVVLAGYAEAFTTEAYPTTVGALKTTQNGTDGVVSRLSNDLSTLMNSTFVGGAEDSDTVNIRDMALAADQSIWITGLTASASFPVSTDAYQTTLSGNEAFATQLSSDLTEVVRSSFIGGPFNDVGYSLALDSAENVVLGLFTNSNSSIATTGAYDETINGQSDIAIVYLDCEVSDTGEKCLADTAAPQIQTLSPADGSTSVDKGTTELVITFDEAVTLGAGTIGVYRSGDDSLLESIDVTGDQSVLSSNQLTLTLSSEFNYGGSYYVQLAAGVVQDLFSNNSVAVGDTTTWNFDIEPNDGTVPILQSTSPADGATEVDPLADLEMTFNEAVGFQSGFLKIYRKSDNQLIDTIDVAGTPSSGNGTQTLALDRQETNLEYGTEYYILVDSGSIRDITGTNFTGVSNATVWNFTTFSNPQVTNLSPANGATGVEIDSNLIMTFNKPSGASSGTIRIYRASDNVLIEEIDVAGGPQITGNGTSTITINPLSDLAAGTEYYVQIDSTAIRANQGPYFAGISDTSAWSFTTVSMTSSLEENESDDESSEIDNNREESQRIEIDSEPSLDPIQPIRVENPVNPLTVSAEQNKQVAEQKEIQGTEESSEQTIPALDPRSFDSLPKGAESPEESPEPETRWYFSVTSISGSLLFLLLMAVLGYISRKR